MPTESLRAGHVDAVIERGATWRLSFMLVMPSGVWTTAAALVPGNHVVTGPSTIEVVYAVEPLNGTVRIRFGQGLWSDPEVTVKADAVFELAAAVSPASVLAAYEYDYPLVTAANGTTTGGPVVAEIPSSVGEDGTVTLVLDAATTWALPADVGAWDMTFTLDTGDTMRVLEGQFASIATVSGEPAAPPGLLGPMLSSLAPPNSPTDTPNTVQALGANFIDGSTIYADDTALVTVYDNASSLLTDITGAAGVGTHPVYIRNPDGQTSNTIEFSLIAPTPPATDPTLDAVTPDHMPTTVDTTVAVTGWGFTAASVVWWGGWARTTTYVSATELSVALGATWTEGTWPLWVDNGDGAISNSLPFTSTDGPPPPGPMVYDLTAQKQPPDPGGMSFLGAQWSANPLWIALVDANGQDNTAVLAAIASNTTIRFTDAGDPARWQEYLAIEAVVVGAGYVAVNNPVHMNAGTNISLPAAVVLTITPPGRHLPW